MTSQKITTMAAAKSEVLQELCNNLKFLSCPYLSTSGEEVENLKDLLADANSRYDFLKWLFGRVDIQLVAGLDNLQEDLKCASFSKIFAKLGLGLIKDDQINKMLLLMSSCSATETDNNYIGSIEDVKYEVDGDWDCSDFKRCEEFIPKIIKIEILKFNNLHKEQKKVELETRLISLEEEHNSTASHLQKLPEINLATKSTLQSLHESINGLSKCLQKYNKIHEFNFDPVLKNSDLKPTNLKSLNLHLLSSYLSQTKTLVEDMEKTNRSFAEIGNASNNLQIFAKENNLA